MIVAEGNLPTPGTAGNFSFGIPLPVGAGYYLSLSGQSAELNDDITCTGSYGPFAVTANSSTPFDMTLLCVDNTNGQVLSNVTVDTPACPRMIVDYVVAEPGFATTSESFGVHASAHDLDDPSKTITFAWSISDAINAHVGAFAPANSKDSSFKCFDQGIGVKLKVTANNGQCSKSLETVISCIRTECGDGVLQPDETCEKSFDPSCPSDCTRVCGDGNAESGETCDLVPANPALCIPPGEPGQCTLRPTNVCGDGYVNGTEKCDTLGNIGPDGLPLANGFTCTDCHQNNLDQVCGDGVKQGIEQCDEGTGSNPTPITALSRTCSLDCKLYSSEACVLCEQAGDCSATSDNCSGVGGSFTPAQRKQCTDVAICMETSGCLAGPTGSLGKCYCGTLSTAACGAAPFDLSAPGAPNGPCAALMQAGAPGVTSNSAMLGGLTTKSRPTGAAGQRLNCDKQNCATECGVN